MSRLEGEASINNRKGKLIFFYEWSLRLAWTGEHRGGVGGRDRGALRVPVLSGPSCPAGTSLEGVTYKGYVEIPNLSDENDVDEVEVGAVAAPVLVPLQPPPPRGEASWATRQPGPPRVYACGAAEQSCSAWKPDWLRPPARAACAGGSLSRAFPV